VQDRHSPACAPGAPAHSPATLTFNRICQKSFPNGHILICYKRGFLPNGFFRVPSVFLSISLTSIVEPLELAFSPFPPMILAYFLGIRKRRSRSTIFTNQFLL
jgi:hypothetical protein